MGLIRVAELLHCHIPSVQKSARRWLQGDALDQIAGERHLRKLVIDQAVAGADYLDVNVDDFLTDADIGRDGTIRLMDHILELIGELAPGIPACIDSSDSEILETGLRHYYQILGSGAPPPLCNSVAITRLELFELRKEFAFSVIGMLLERVDSGMGFTDIAGPEVYRETAKFLFDKAIESGFAPGEVFLDPTVGPLGADMVGYTRRTFEGIKSIREDPDMEGVHVLIGLSNCSDGLPRRLAINRAYLRVAIENGLDSAVLDVLQVTGKDLVDPRILKLVKDVATAEDGSAVLPKLVDFAQAHPSKPSVPDRQPMPNTFRQTLEAGTAPAFILELAPAEGKVDSLLEMAEATRETPFTLSVTDTPGGNRSPGPDTLGLEIARITGRQPIVNLSCKSEDRDGLIRRVLGMYNQGLRNVFAVTGDYPVQGRAAFDLDAVTLLMATSTLRRGLNFPDLMPRPGQPLGELTAGAAVSPFKYLEPDLWGQYLKLWKKRQAGADYFITQVGFDVKKFQELKLVAARMGLSDVPMIGTVFVLTPQVVLALNRIHVAGVVLPEDLKAKYRGRLMSKKERSGFRKLSFVETAQEERKVYIRRAALLADILVRGLGYQGIDLAGISDLKDALEVMDLYRDLSGQDWRESYAEYRDADGKRELQLAPDNPFYLFPEGDDGLLVDGPYQTPDRSAYPKPGAMMGWIHRRFFEDGTIGYGLMKGLMGGENEGATARMMTLAEQAIKTSSLGCEMCGDCRIADLQYLCPEPTDGCAKRLTNGPCGGADEAGMCEVNRERRCYWGEVIERALKTDTVDRLFPLQLPKDPSLVHTSSWRNEVLSRCPEPLDLGAPTEVPTGD